MTNITQVGGTTTDTNSGSKSAGTLRVVLATDQPALTNKLLVTPDSVALPANQSVNVAQQGGVATQMSGSDGVTSANIPAKELYLYNGASSDMMRGNIDNITVLASASRSTTQTQADQTNYNHRGIMVVLDMTNVASSPSVTLEIDGKDPVSGKYVALLTGAAVTTAVTNIYTVYPGNTVAANVSASTVLPRTWRIKVTANNANAGTYSVGAMLIV